MRARAKTLRPLTGMRGRFFFSRRSDLVVLLRLGIGALTQLMMIGLGKAMGLVEDEPEKVKERRMLARQANGFPGFGEEDLLALGKRREDDVAEARVALAELRERLACGVQLRLAAVHYDELGERPLGMAGTAAE